MAEHDRRTRSTGDTTRLDAVTGLYWEATPAPAEDTFAAAQASAGEGWRLPSAVELMLFLTGLPDRASFPSPHAGDVFWSSSESPFASTESVRAVAYEPSRPAVLLLEKAASARCWRVKDEES